MDPVGQEGNAHADEEMDDEERASKISRIASLPEGVNPIWIGCVGGDDVIEDAQDDDSDAADSELLQDAGDEGNAMARMLYMICVVEALKDLEGRRR